MASSVYQRPVERRSVGKALVISADAGFVDQCRRALRGIDVSATHVHMVRDALELINGEKFEAFIIDTALDTPYLDLLSEARISASNKHAVIFALAESASVSEAAKKVGANFTLEKPVHWERLNRTLRAAHGLILREYRRYFRYPTRLPVIAQSSVAGEMTGEMVNLSEEGMAARLPYSLVAGTELIVRFKLPGQANETISRATLAWTEEIGMTGLKFLNMPDAMKAQLHEFLSARLEEMISAPARKPVVVQ